MCDGQALIAKDAALRAAHHHILTNEAGWSDTLDTIRAALSPSAGEGWVSPDNVKRLLEYCNHHSSCILEHHAPGVRDCGCGYIEALRAALRGKGE